MATAMMQGGVDCRVQVRKIRTLLLIDGTSVADHFCLRLYLATNTGPDYATKNTSNEITEGSEPRRTGSW
jgi:hypothetical protein